MSHTTKILKERSLHDFYADIENVEALGVPRRAVLIGNEWRLSTTLWLVVIAMILWLLTYLMTIVITMYFDYGMRSVVVLSTLLGWSNETTFIANEEDTQLIVTF